MRNPDPPPPVTTPPAIPSAAIASAALTAHNDSGQNLHLCSDNPSPQPPLQPPFEPTGAAVRMACYRIAAVFGELRWVSPDQLEVSSAP